jgi:iron complex transport system substrate-binding protein
MNAPGPHHQTPPAGRHTLGRSRLRLFVALATVVVVAAATLAGCSIVSYGGASAAGGDPSGTADAPAAGERVVALGEERVLADLLALGVRPVASTANVVVDGGFVGLDGFDTDGIEPLPSNDPNIERLAALHPDVIVANQFVVDYLGRNVLEPMGRLIVVPDGDATAQVQALGDAFDRRAEADALVDQLEQAIADWRADLADLPAESLTVSVATIYPGSTVAAWVAGPVDVPATLLDLGFTLRPDAAAVAGAQGGATEGRAYLSEEQIGLLDARTLVAMQSEHVEGESEALDAMT